MAFIMLRMFPLSLRGEFFLTWMVVEFFYMLFLHNWDDHVFFILPFINVVYPRYWFADVEKCLWPSNKFKLTVLYEPFFMYCWTWFANIFWGFCIFTYAYHFFIVSLPGFAIRKSIGLRKNLKVSPPLKLFVIVWDW